MEEEEEGEGEEEEPEEEGEESGETLEIKPSASAGGGEKGVVRRAIDESSEEPPE